MRQHNIYRGVPGLLGLTALILTGCPTEEPPGTTITCGPNTEEVDGKCVSTVDEAPCADGASRNPDSGQCEPDVDCGAGTTYNPATQECDPDSVCGPATTFNEATGQCEPDVVCGDDTTFDPSTGACRPDVVCGDGTSLDASSGNCVPDENCGTGTTFDPTTGTCVPDLVCGPGLTSVEGVCLSALDIIVAELDVAEPATDTNDPALGGTAESVTLEAIGERAVFTGTIQRPVDLNADTVIDQDVDVWRFTGSQGQMLRIRVISTGAFQPAFTLTGPNDYYREPQVGFAVDADRQVVLPYDGEYDLTVLPSLVLQGVSEPIGDDDAVYAAIIEETAWPTPATVTIPGTGEAATAQGNLLNLHDNFFDLAVPADGPVHLLVTAPEGNTTPVLLLFTGDGSFVKDAPFSATGGIESALTAMYATVPPGLVALLDWQTSNGVDVAFDLSATALESADFGTVPVGETIALPTLAVPGLGGISFTFDVTAGQVVLTDFIGLSADLTLLSPSGEVLFSGPKPFFDAVFLAQESGLHRWVVVNTSASDSTASVAIRSFTPHDAGTYDGSADLQQSYSGDVIAAGQRPGGEWFVVDNTAPGIARFDFDFNAGMPDIELYSLNEGGVAVSRRFNGEDDPATLRAYLAEPTMVLTRLHPALYGATPDPAIRDWRVDVLVHGLPTDTESEPNDTMDAPNALPSLPARVLGESIDDEIDLFSLTVSPPLQDGEAIVIDAENLTGTTSVWMRIRAAGTTLEDDELYESAQVPLTRWMILPGDGPGPFVIELEGTGDNPFEYMLEVKRVSVNTESGDNNTLGGAQDLGTVTVADLPMEIYGTTKSTDVDVFQLALDTALPAGTALRVRAENLVESFDLRFAAYDAAQQLTTSTDHEDGVLLVNVPDTNPVFLEVKGESSSRVELYRIVIDTLSTVETEPNDSIATATPLPSLAVGDSTSIWGSEIRTKTDYYAISIDEALAEGEAIAVRWHNAMERGNIRVAVADTAGVEVASSVVYSDELYFAPTGVGPFYVSVSPASTSANARPELYLLEVSRLGEVVVDTEPNDVVAEAQDLTLPAHVLGQFYDDDADMYAVTLDQNAAAGATLIVDGLVPFTSVYATVRVTDELGAELGTATDLIPYVEVDIGGATAGTAYYVSVEGPAVSPDYRYAYDLMIDIDVP